MNSTKSTAGRRGVGGQQTTSTSVRRSSRLSNGGSDVEQDHNVAVSAPASKAPVSRRTASSAAAATAIVKAKAHNIPPDLFSPSATSRAAKKGKSRTKPTNKRKISVAATTQASVATMQQQPGTIASGAARPRPKKARASKRRKQQSTSSDDSSNSAASAATEKRRTASIRQPPAPPQKQSQQQQCNSVTPSPIGGPIGLGGVPPSASAVTDGAGMRTPTSTGPSDHFPNEGAAVKEALRVECEHGDAAAGYASSDLLTPTGSRTDEDVSMCADEEHDQAKGSSNQDVRHSHHQYRPPPEGVVDLDLLAIQHMHVRANPLPYHPAEPYCFDTSTAYLAQYGRDYYRNLSDASTHHQRALSALHRKGKSPLNMMSVYGGSGEHSNDSHGSTASSGSVRLPHQSEISVVMRGILVDWLAELKHSFKLVDNTLHLSVKLLDRVLCHWDLEKKMFQCLGW